MTAGVDDGRPVHVLVFPADLGAADALESALRDGARAITLEAAGFVRPAGLLSVALACSQARATRASITVNRSRSAAADSYLAQVGFYSFLQRLGGVVTGASSATRSLEPLTGLVELANQDRAERQVAQCSAALVRLGTRPVDAERLRRALDAALACLMAGGPALLIAERYADAAGWTRIEVGIGGLGRPLAAHEWSDLNQALGESQGGSQAFGSTPCARLVEHALGRGPGALELRSGETILSAGTRSGLSRRVGSPIVGTRLGLILNAAPKD